MGRSIRSLNRAMLLAMLVMLSLIAGLVFWPEPAELYGASADDSVVLSPAIVARLRAATEAAPIPGRPSETKKRVYGTITVTPAGGTFPDSITTVNVTIDMCSEDTEIDDASFMVLYADQDVTSDFTFQWRHADPPCYWQRGQARATGTLTLEAGSKYFWPIVYDIASDPIGTEDGPWIFTHVLPAVEVSPEVAVMPKSEPFGIASGETGSRRFVVINQRTQSRTFSVARSCSGHVSCTASTTSHTIAGGGSLAVDVSFSASGTWLQTGTVSVNATDQTNFVNDVGTVDVTIGPPGETSLPVLVSPSQLRRDLCLNMAVGDAASIECGDLRIGHALPPTMVMGVVRTPMLTYNSQHAEPFVLIPANVTLSSGQALPTNVHATLKVNGTSRDTRTWPGSNWGSPGQTRRIVVGFDASSEATGLHQYIVEVRRESGAGTVVKSDTGEFVVVNRSQSAFGAGWALAGVDTLIHVSPTRKLWIGGDGSAQVFSAQVSGAWDSLWTAPKADNIDSLVYDDGYYQLLLPEGGRVVFSPSGAHNETRNRLASHLDALNRTDSLYRTRFSYDGSGRLSSIRLPTPSAGWLTYGFHYNGSSGKLDSVTAPVTPGASRTTRFRVISGVLDTITDPGVQTVVFGYESGTKRMSRRRNRRYYQDQFEYDAGSRVSVVRRNGNAVVTTVQAFESRGFSGTAVSPATAYTAVDGPRTDVVDSTRFWLNGYGSVRRVRNALGHETVVEYGSATWPAIATRVQQMNGLVSRAWLGSTRPLVDSTRIEDPYGDGRNPTTRYEWHPTLPFVTKVIAADSGVAITEYDSYGLRIWQQVGTSSSRRVAFGYNANFQLDSIKDPGVAAESLSYDALGNLRKVRSPAGRHTLSFKDAIGRDTLVLTPTTDTSATDSTKLQARGVRHRILYNAAGYPWRTATIGPALNPGVTQPTVLDSMVVETTYDAEGNAILIDRYAFPDSAQNHPVQTFRSYDFANRVINGENGTYIFDAAGNQTQWATFRLDTIRTSYDPLNRPVRKIIPSRFFATSTVCNGELGPIGYGDSCERFPYYGSLRIERDVHLFRYELGGGLTAADNRYARVARTYYRNGQLATDTLRIRAYDAPADGPGGQTTDPGDFTTYKYGLRFGYDSVGRRAWMESPLSVSGSKTRYYYSRETSMVDSLRDAAGNGVQFNYSDRLALSQISSPGSVVETRTYDDDGLITSRSVTAPYGTVQDETLTYDGRGKVVEATTYGTAQRFDQAAYSGLGHLVYASFGFFSPSAPLTTEEWRVDALGDKYCGRYRHSDGIDRTSRHVYVDGAHTPNVIESRPTTPACQGWNLFTQRAEYSYDNAGSMVETIDRGYDEAQCQVDQTTRTRSKSYYAADGRLRVFQRLGSDLNAATRSVYEEYRYDALGRRVMLRSRADSNCTAVVSGTGKICISALERYVWDGDQLVYETRETTNGSTAGSAHYGDVHYTHGGGIDQPLVVIKPGYMTFVPHASWRGTYETGTSSAGADLKTTIPWPGRLARAFLGTPTPEPTSWYGSLIQGSRDQSGLMYRRNRYYDPASGMFTQQDPIGLAGGLNLYGYADGDPVNFSDPFGLCPFGPKRDTNVLDCPKGELGSAFKFLAAYGGEQGRVTIETVASGKADIRMVSADEMKAKVGNPAVRGLYQRGNKELLIRSGRGGARTAVTVAHEVGHLLEPNKLTAGWDAALKVWSGLPGYVREPGFEGVNMWRITGNDLYIDYVRRAEGQIKK